MFQLSTAANSPIVQIMDSLLPGDFFKKKATEKLCGIRHARSQRYLNFDILLFSVKYVTFS